MMFNAMDYFTKVQGCSVDQARRYSMLFLQIESGARKAVDRELTDEEKRSLAWLCTMEYSTWENIHRLFAHSTIALEKARKGQHN